LIDEIGHEGNECKGKECRVLDRDGRKHHLNGRRNVSIIPGKSETKEKKVSDELVNGLSGWSKCVLSSLEKIGANGRCKGSHDRFNDGARESVEAIEQIARNGGDSI
jgi:hypothetical protein